MVTGAVVALVTRLALARRGLGLILRCALAIWNLINLSTADGGYGVVGVGLATVGVGLSL